VWHDVLPLTDGRIDEVETRKTGKQQQKPRLHDLLKNTPRMAE
jgi:hypothetical protein